MRSQLIRGFLASLTVLSLALWPGSSRATESSESLSLPSTQAPVTPPNTPGAGAERQPGERVSKGMHKMRESCGTDIAQHCATVKPGGGRIVHCLEQHQSEISPGCQQMLQQKGLRHGKNR